MLEINDAIVTTESTYSSVKINTDLLTAFDALTVNINLKADQTDVDLKANQTDLDLKANHTDLNLKANQTDLDTAMRDLLEDFPKLAISASIFDPNLMPCL